MVGGVLKRLKSVKVVDSTGTLRKVFSGLTVSSNFASFSGSGSGEPLYSTPTCVVTPSGGTGPYTYAWTLVETDGFGSSSASAPTSANTTFYATGLTNFVTHITTWRCTVTDSGGVTGNVDVVVTFTKLGGIIP